MAETTVKHPIQPEDSKVKPPKKKWHQRLVEAIGTAIGEWFVSI